MARLIIDYPDDMTAVNALEFVQVVVREGKVSHPSGVPHYWSSIACLAFERKLEEYEVSTQHKPKPSRPLPGSTAVACGMGIGVTYV